MEINVESEINYSQIAANALEKYMIEAANIWCKTVPMKATAAIGKHWGH